MMEKQMELFARGGLKDEGGMIDEESGNEVPVGGTREGVRDDIDANVSNGEFIFSEDVTRYIGLDKLMQLRQQAKMGLKRMEAMGQMGNSDEATMDDDLPFGMDDLIIVAGDSGNDGEINMAVGGLTTGTTDVMRTPDPVAAVANNPVVPLSTSTRRLTPEITQPVRTTVDFKKLMGDASIEYKEYRNAAGNNILVPFIGGKATFPIPDGYTLYTGTDAPVGSGTTPTDNIVADANTATQERRSNNDDRTNVALPPPEAIDWDNLSYEEYMDKSSTLVGVGRTFAKAATLFMGPLAIFPMAAMAHQDKKALLGATKLLNSGLLNAEQIAALKTRTEGINEHAGGLINNVLGDVFGGVIDAVAGALGKLPEEVAEVKKVAVETGVKVDPTPRVFLPQNTGMPLTKAILPPVVSSTNASGDPSETGTTGVVVPDQYTLASTESNRFVKPTNASGDPSEIGTTGVFTNASGDPSETAIMPIDTSTYTPPSVTGINAPTPFAFKELPIQDDADDFTNIANRNFEPKTIEVIPGETVYDNKKYVAPKPASDYIGANSFKEAQANLDLRTAPMGEAQLAYQKDATRSIDSLMPPTVAEQTASAFPSYTTPSVSGIIPPKPINASGDPSETGTTGVFTGTRPDALDLPQVSRPDQVVGPLTSEMPMDITEDAKLDITKTEPVKEEKTGLGVKVSKPKQIYKAGQSNQATAWENLPDVNLDQAYELSERYKTTGGTTVDNYAVGAVSDGSSTGILSDDQGFAIRADNGRNVFVDEQGEYHRPTWGEMIKNGRNFKQRNVGDYDRNKISIASTDRVSTVTAARKNELSATAKAKIGKDASGGDPNMKGAVWYNQPGTNVLTRKFPTAAEKKEIKAEQDKQARIEKTRKAVADKKAEDARIRAESIRRANEVYAQQQAAAQSSGGGSSSRDRRKKQKQAQASATRYTKSAISRNAGKDGKVTKDTYKGGGF
jgi:hypothetical protein